MAGVRRSGSALRRLWLRRSGRGFSGSLTACPRAGDAGALLLHHDRFGAAMAEALFDGGGLRLLQRQGLSRAPRGAVVRLAHSCPLSGAGVEPARNLSGCPLERPKTLKPPRLKNQPFRQSPRFEGCMYHILPPEGQAQFPGIQAIDEHQLQLARAGRAKKLALSVARAVAGLDQHRRWRICVKGPGKTVKTEQDRAGTPRQPEIGKHAATSRASVRSARSADRL